MRKYFQQDGEQLKTRLIMILCLCVLAPTLTAGEVAAPYISPGVTFGYTFGSGVYTATQLTVGILLPFDEYPFVPYPGITVGRRFSKQSVTTFVDFQLSAGFAGAGYGKAWVESKDDSGSLKLSHFKVWGGLWGLVQYDLFFSPEIRLHSMSATGVYPIFDWNKTFGSIE